MWPRGKPRKIMEISTGHQFRSIAAVCQKTGLTFLAVTRMIERGDRFRYLTDADNPTSISKENTSLRAENIRQRAEIARLRQQLTPPSDRCIKSYKNKPVVEPATGQIWPSAATLIRELGCHPITMYKHLNGVEAYRTVYCRVFRYQSEGNTDD